jgi:Uma2 family endonuclease
MVSTIAETALPVSSDLEEFLPESDGKPMAETDLHRDQMVYLLEALRDYFRDDPQIYVTGNIFLYYRDEAHVKQSVSPDILAVRGVAKHKRRIYDLDKELLAPQLVIELTSASTKVEDLVTKRYIYRNLGVSEYYLFDPYSEILEQPNFRGFRLEGGDYVPMVGSRLSSQVLGLDMRVEDGFLRLYDPKTGDLLLDHDLAQAARRKAQAKARAAETKARSAAKKAAQESAARKAAEEELARLREEVSKLRNKQQ